MAFSIEKLEGFIKEDEFAGDVVQGGFEMNPVEDSYEVVKNGKTICTVDFVDKKDNSVDMEVAQGSPKDYIVVFSNIKDFALANNYEDKLSDMGFEINIAQK